LSNPFSGNLISNNLVPGSPASSNLVANNLVLAPPVLAPPVSVASTSGDPVGRDVFSAGLFSADSFSRDLSSGGLLPSDLFSVQLFSSIPSAANLLPDELVARLSVSAETEGPGASAAGSLPASSNPDAAAPAISDVPEAESSANLVLENLDPHILLAIPAALLPSTLPQTHTKQLSVQLASPGPSDPKQTPVIKENLPSLAGFTGNNPFSHFGFQPFQNVPPYRETLFTPEAANPMSSFAAPGSPLESANPGTRNSTYPEMNDTAPSGLNRAVSSALAAQAAPTRTTAASQPGTSASDTLDASAQKANTAVSILNGEVAPASPQPAAIALAGPAMANPPGQSPASSGTTHKPDSSSPAASDLPSNATTAADLPPYAGSGPVQMAQMVNKAEQSEMRIGLNTAAFGNVEVRTVVHANEVGVLIGSEKGDLRSLLAAELPGITSTLQQQSLRLNPVNFHQGFAFSNQMSSGGDSQPRSFARPAAPGNPSYGLPIEDAREIEPSQMSEMSVTGSLSILA
jgi:hypothetical protein